MASTGEIGLEEGWKKIKEQAISKLEDMLDEGLNVNTTPFPPKAYSPIYTICYDMCTQRTPFNWSSELYERHGLTIQEYLKNKVLPALKDKHDESLLRELASRWERHKVMNKWMQKFFMYLDRYHVHHHSLPSLHKAGLMAFKTLVFDEVKADVVAAMLVLINAEREGEIVDRELLKSCVDVFEAMGMQSVTVYNNDFEAFLLDSSGEYFSKKSQSWIAMDNTPDYMKKAEAALEQESRRVEAYLIASTETKLLAVCESQLLKQHERTLLEKEGSGLRALLQDDKKDDLARMFRLFSRVDQGLVPIANVVREHIVKMGNEIVGKREATIAAKDGKDSASDPTFVQALLQLHDVNRALVTDQFSGHNLFQKALKEAFEVFVNNDVGKITNAEMMSTFCDRVLKTGGEKLNEEQIEEYLEKVVNLFSYLSDKDLFSEIYRNQLAKRLLDGRSQSDDAERSMISKLKLRCGAQFTGKMEGMITDLSLGDDGKRKFREYVKKTFDTDKLHGIDFSVEVLTTGFWPTYIMYDVTLPAVMAKCREEYSKYYDTETSHRQLKWVYSLGNAVIKASYKTTYDLQVTTLQAVALLNMNDKDKDDWISFPDLCAAMNVEEEVVKRVAHSLSCGKYKVLEKNPKSKGISKSDKFRVNGKFSCPLRKLRIPMASLEKSHNPKRVEDDRSIAIEAAIVRIMKARKKLAHHQLISEVLQQLHFFKPNPKVVKKRIEHLIDREYLERDEEQSNMYNYLA